MLYIYFVYKYNLIYSYDADIDTKGLLYPHALMQLFVGLYLSQICLIGLFVLNAAVGPVLLMALFVVFTALVHISLSDALGPLLSSLPRTLALQDQSLTEDSTQDGALNPDINDQTPADAQGGTASEYYNMEEGFGMDPEPEPTHPNTDDTTDRGIEGAGGFVSTLGKFAWLTTSSKLTAEADESGLTLLLARVMAWITPDIDRKPNFVMKWLHPEVYEDFHVLKELMPREEEGVFEVPEQIARRGYLPPEMWVPAPRLWIPRDEARVSRQEVRHSGEVVAITDRGAWLDGKGRVVADLGVAPYKEVRVLY
jgi:hypothetical protein